MTTHWLTLFDADGDPYGVVCDCEIEADHLASGRLFPEPEAASAEESP